MNLEKVEEALEVSIGFAKSAIYSAESTPHFPEGETNKYRKSHDLIIEALTELTAYTERLEGDKAHLVAMGEVYDQMVEENEALKEQLNNTGE